MTSRPRPYDLRDDLLADLRQATPVPPPAAEPAAAETTAAPDSAAPDSAAPSAPAPDRSLPAVEIRISLQPWSAPRLATDPSGFGLVLRGGPLRVRLGLYGRR